MGLVLDASIVHAWAFDEGEPLAETVRQLLRHDTAVAPNLWWFEVRNGLVMAERRGRVSKDQSDMFLEGFIRFPGSNRSRTG